MADPQQSSGLLDDIWGGWSDFWKPKDVPQGAPYSPDTLGLARANAIGNLGGTLLALSQGGLSPEFRAQLLAKVGDAGPAYQQTLASGVAQRLGGAQAAKAEQEVASQKASDSLFDAELQRRRTGAVAPAPAVTPGNLPTAPAIATALASLKGSESGGNPALINKQGYSGLYQMGTGLAHAAGVYKPAQDEATTDDKGRAVNAWRGQWVVPGFNPMSHDEFLRNPDAQQRAAELAMKYNQGQIEQAGLDKYIGKTVDGVTITPEGLLQGAWLGGVKGLKTWLSGAGDPADENNATVSRWAGLKPPGGTTVATNTTSSTSPTTTDTPVVPGGTLQGTAKVGGLGDLTPQQLALLRSMPYAERAQWLLAQSQAQYPRLLTDKEVVGAGFPAGTVVQLGPGGLQVVQQSTTNLTTEQKQTHEDTLRQRLEQGTVYTNYAQAQPSIQAVRQAYATKDPAGRGAADLDMIIGYAKLLDPNSVVRESEGDNVRKIGGVFDNLSTLVDNIRSGAKLDDNTRQQILHSAESRWKAYEDPYRNRVNQYRTFATQYGLEPDRVAPAIEATSKYGAQPTEAELVTELKARVQSKQYTKEKAVQIAKEHGIDPKMLD